MTIRPSLDIPIHMLLRQGFWCFLALRIIGRQVVVSGTFINGTPNVHCGKSRNQTALLDCWFLDCRYSRDRARTFYICRRPPNHCRTLLRHKVWSPLWALCPRVAAGLLRGSKTQGLTTPLKSGCQSLALSIKWRICPANHHTAGTPTKAPITDAMVAETTGRPTHDPISDAKKTFTAMAPAANGYSTTANLTLDQPCCITAAAP